MVDAGTWGQQDSCALFTEKRASSNFPNQERRCRKKLRWEREEGCVGRFVLITDSDCSIALRSRLFARQGPDSVGFRAASPPIDTYIDPSRSQRMTRSRVIDERRTIGITKVTVRSSLRTWGVLPGRAITIIAPAISVKGSERGARGRYKPSRRAAHRLIGVCSNSATKCHLGPSSRHLATPDPGRRGSRRRFRAASTVPASAVSGRPLS